MAFPNITPQLIQAFFCLALQFAYKDHPEHPWSPNEQTASMYILTDMAEDAKTVNIRPTVIVENQGLAFNNDSIGNVDGIERHKEYLIKHSTQFTVSGTMVLQCIADAKIAAEELAYETALFMAAVRSHLEPVLKLQYLSMPQVSKASPIAREGGVTAFACQVVISYSYALKRAQTPVDLGPLLSTLDFSTIPTSNPVLGGGGIGGTYTGGITGNWGGIGGPGGGDYIDDGVAHITPVITSV